MKFVMAVKKHGKGTATIAKGHNLREYQTNSQLPKSAWITKAGQHTITAWRDDVIDAAKGLAKRKDAVVAVEIVLQVGNQADWREMPTAEHPEGKALPGAAAKLNALHKGALQAIEREFGKENVVSIVMHTDESTPHVHALVVPVRDGKLQAKAWLDGPAKCAQLRERLYADVNKHIACAYEKGAPGGDPLDKHMRAGGARARKPPAPEPDGWVEKVKGLIDKSEEVKKLKEGMEKVQQQLDRTQRDLATVFSQLKSALKRADSAEKRVEIERKEREKMEEAAKRLKAELDALKPQPVKPAFAGFGDVLAAAKKAPEAPNGTAPDGATEDPAGPPARRAKPKGPRP